MSSKQDIVDLIALFRAAFPNYHPEADSLQTLYSLLQDVPGEVLLIAARACTTEPNRAFAPSIGELRGKIVELAKRAAGIPSAWEAWEMIYNNRPGQYYYNCEIGAAIKERANHPKDSQDYWQAMQDHETHLAECQECGWQVHGVKIPEIVITIAKRLGWPDSFPGANMIETDRAHFIRAYDDAINKAPSQAAEPAEIKAYIGSNTSQAIKLLAEGMKR